MRKKIFHSFIFHSFLVGIELCTTPETFRQDDQSLLNQTLLSYWRHTIGHLWLMGNLCQCLFTLTVKNCFFISNLNLPSSFARLDTHKALLSLASPVERAHLPCTSASQERIYDCAGLGFSKLFMHMLYAYTHYVHLHPAFRWAQFSLAL